MAICDSAATCTMAQPLCIGCNAVHCVPCARERHFLLMSPDSLQRTYSHMQLCLSLAAIRDTCCVTTHLGKRTGANANTQCRSQLSHCIQRGRASFAYMAASTHVMSCHVIPSHPQVVITSMDRGDHLLVIGSDASNSSEVRCRRSLPLSEGIFSCLHEPRVQGVRCRAPSLQTAA